MYTRILVFLTVYLKTRNIISKIKRSKVTDYAALILPNVPSLQDAIVEARPDMNINP